MRRFRVAVLVGVAVVLALAVSRSAAAPLPTVTNVTVAPVPNKASHLAKYTITFTTTAAGALVTGDTITLKFPSGTVPGGSCGNVASFTNNVTVNGATTSVSAIVTCLDVRVTVPAGAGIGNNSLVTVVVGSSTNVVRNPGKGTFAMKVHTTKDFGDAGSARYTIAAQAKPVANGQAVSTSEDAAPTIMLTGSDADGDPLTFSISQVPAHGGLSAITQLTPTSANVTYTPVGNYSGPDSFKFRVNDGVVTSSAATVSITVTPVNDAPDAVDDDVTVAQGSGATAIAVRGNDSDADGNALTITSSTPASNGTATCSASDCTYMPNALFSGNDSFTYTISDGSLSDTATVHVEVTPPPGGGGGTASAELCAKTGSVTMPDTVVIDIWGFALGDCTGAGPATLPGPPLTVSAGDTVSITIDNGLPAGNVSLEIPGQNIAPDPTGVAPGFEKTYTFVASSPGTYLYESGVGRQVMMGLYGSLIVNPATAGQAYDSAASAYDEQATLVLSEIDPAFNDDPNNFDLLGFAPKYWLVNGESFPDTASPPGMDTIMAAAGDRVLLRYLNAGSIHDTMALLGLHQRVIGRDAFPVRYPYDVVGETIPAGSTLDAIATIPDGTKPTYPLYNRQLHLDNAGATPGGMMVLLDPQPATARSLALTVGSLTASARGHRVRIGASTVACSPCKARARIRVHGVWRSLLMSRSNGRWVASFPGVPSGRWAYEVRVRDVDSGIALASARQSVRVG